jgi:cellulose synthase/poly-beta-1,6-N-acetylglucosamine synthase-like glycosyltransferase
MADPVENQILDAAGETVAGGDSRDRPGAVAKDAAAAPLLSFVIPAFNEEDLLPRTIWSIRDLVSHVPHEILVVDNDSTDGTRRIAAELGAQVIRQSGGTIGSLRNRGVEAARGEILVFLDADVIVTPEWADRLPESIGVLREGRVVTGARCNVPEDATWLERYWFASRGKKSTHVGSGHMLMTRQFFQEVGGFDESLATGEDYELSRRAVARGGQIASDPRLRAVHLGFPRTVRAFLQRESWHGVGDFRSFSAFIRSKVAVSAAAFALLHLVVAVGLLGGATPLALAAVGGIIFLCLASSYHQYRAQPIPVILLNAGIYWIYYLGRTLAFGRRVVGSVTRGSR